MLELYHDMKLQDFLSCSEFYIKNDSKVDASNNEVRKLAVLILVGYESMGYRFEKFGIRPCLTSQPSERGWTNLLWKTAQGMTSKNSLLLANIQYSHRSIGLQSAFTLLE